MPCWLPWLERWLMASSGPNSPSSASADTSIGTRGWSVITNVLAEDGNNAVSGPFGGANISYYIAATGFGFSIPAGSTIDGIVVEWKKFASNNWARDYAIRIIKNGTIGTTDQSAAGDWPTSATYSTYGSSTYLWGETWTADDINSSGFGSALSARESSLYYPSVDHVRITVYYTTSSQAGRSMHQFRMRR